MRRPSYWIRFVLIISVIGFGLGAIKGSSDSNQMCTLQVSAKRSPGRRHSPAEYNASHAQEIASKEYCVFAQQKAGFMMSVEAVKSMQSALAGLQNVPPLSVTVSHTLPWALSQSDIHTTEKPVCFLHVNRNPFEMLVSGYLYHMAVAEDWMLTSFSQATAQSGDRSDGIPKNNLAAGLYGVADVFSSSRSGSLSAWLPDANASETYPAYLNRINLDAGLVAHFTWAQNTSLASMRFSDVFVESQPCSINVCYRSFLEQCNATWQEVFRAWEISEPLFLDTMLRSATESCPARSDNRMAHSSGSIAEARSLTHPPHHEMVKRLRELDDHLLNGTIAALEEQLGCPLSRKYQ